MTAYYVRSGATGSANGTSWANAYTTMATALSGKAAGDVFYVSEDHSETTAGALTLTFPGTPTNPNSVYCVDHAGSVPPISADLRTTASIATSSTNASITIAGSLYSYGLQLKPSSGNPSSIILGSATANGNVQTHKSITLQHASASASLNIGLTARAHKIILIDPIVTFSSTTSVIFLLGNFRWSGGSVSGTVPTTLFSYPTNCGWIGELTGVDLSALGSGKTLFGTVTNSGYVSLRRCKIGASVAVAATIANPGNPLIDMVNCDSGATNYRNERYRYEGTLTTETTIVRSGGASDGTTPVSHKIATTANSLWANPFESFPLAIWNDTVGSPVTATVYGIWGGGSVPNNDDIWIEAEYLGDSASPQSSIASSCKANGLASGAAVSSDASTWGGSTTAFKMSVTFTPQQKGLINIVVKAAKASSTFYIDPKPVLS